jgi:hypothetical protein
VTPAPRSGITTRWLAFEDRAFLWIGRAERYIRGLPANTRIVPGTFERLLFRIAMAAVVGMVSIMAVPSRTFRIRALLLLLLALFVLIMGAAYRDAFPGRKR